MKRIPTKHLDYAVRVSPSYRYVYIDNPKTGCSSLKSALLELELRDSRSELDVYDWRNLHDPGVLPFLQLGDIKSRSPLSDLVSQGYRFVTFVRNPYTRLLSGYRDKILRNRPQKDQVLRLLGYSDKDRTRQISFSEFVHGIVRQRDRQMNPHWRPQTSQIMFGVLPYHFIGRFEHYQRDFEALFKSLDIPQGKLPAARHLNRSKDSDQENCRSYYNDELRELVFTRYRDDFRNFNYREELPE